MAKMLKQPDANKKTSFLRAHKSFTEDNIGKCMSDIQINLKMNAKNLNTTGKESCNALFSLFKTKCSLIHDAK